MLLSSPADHRGGNAKLPVRISGFRAIRDGDSRFPHLFLDANPQTNSRLSLDAFIPELMVPEYLSIQVSTCLKTRVLERSVWIILEYLDTPNIRVTEHRPHSSEYSDTPVSHYRIISLSFTPSHASRTHAAFAFVTPHSHERH